MSPVLVSKLFSPHYFVTGLFGLMLGLLLLYVTMGITHLTTKKRIFSNAQTIKCLTTTNLLHWLLLKCTISIGKFSITGAATFPPSNPSPFCHWHTALSTSRHNGSFLRTLTPSACCESHSLISSLLELS